jgi:hypothetical protein
VLVRLDHVACRIVTTNQHRNPKRFVVRADEKLTAFAEVEAAICVFRRRLQLV